MMRVVVISWNYIFLRTRKVESMVKIEALNQRYFNHRHIKFYSIFPPCYYLVETLQVFFTTRAFKNNLNRAKIEVHSSKKKRNNDSPL